RDRNVTGVQTCALPISDALGEDRRRVAARGARQQDGEFLAAIAAENVDGAQGGAAPLGQRAQHLIADVMAVLVVDGLEVVDVEQDRKSTRLNSSHVSIS